MTTKNNYTNEFVINQKIQNCKKEWMKTDDISDGYHTFWELYKHRIVLFIKLAELAYNDTDSMGIPYWHKAIRSKIHEDWLDVWNEWWMFLLCLHTPEWQISYHLDKEYWNKCDFAITEEQATIPWDGHTSDDVLERLLRL